MDKLADIEGVPRADVVRRLLADALAMARVKVSADEEYNAEEWWFAARATATRRPALQSGYSGWTWLPSTSPRRRPRRSASGPRACLGGPMARRTRRIRCYSRSRLSFQSTGPSPPKNERRTKKMKRYIASKHGGSMNTWRHCIIALGKFLKSRSWEDIRGWLKGGQPRSCPT